MFLLRVDSRRAFVVAFASAAWSFVCFAPGIAEGQEYDEATTSRPALNQLRQKAAYECSYRYSNNIYNVSETHCRECVLHWAGDDTQLMEEVDKLVYRMTFDCRPMRNLKESLRKLCRSSSLPERRTLQAYVDCDECLGRNGVKDVGTTFDEVVNARKNCIRVGHKVTVLTSSFGGKIYKDFKYDYDYELLREMYRKGCEEHFSEQTVSTCRSCFDSLFLWPEYPADQASKKLRSCLPALSYKELLARPCQFLNHPIYQSLFVSVGYEQCRACFENATIQQNASREEQLTISYYCLPPANPREELQLQLCSKIDQSLPLWNNAAQPRDLCFDWAVKQNLSAGTSYIQIRNYLIDTCSGDYKAMEKCRDCIQLALSRIASSPTRVVRHDFDAAFRCLFANKNQNPSQLDTTSVIPPPLDDSAMDDLLVPNLNNGGQVPGNPAIRIASDSR